MDGGGWRFGDYQHLFASLDVLRALSIGYRIARDLEDQWELMRPGRNRYESWTEEQLQERFGNIEEKMEALSLDSLIQQYQQRVERENAPGSFFVDAKEVEELKEEIAKEEANESNESNELNHSIISHDTKSSLDDEPSKESITRFILDLTNGFWDDAMDVLKLTEKGAISVDSWHQIMGEKTKEMKSFLSSSFQTLSLSKIPIFELLIRSIHRFSFSLFHSLRLSEKLASCWSRGSIIHYEPIRSLDRSIR